MPFFKRFFMKKKVKIPNMESCNNIFVSPQIRDISSISATISDTNSTDEFNVRDEFQKIGIGLGYKIYAVHSKSQGSSCFVITDNKSNEYFMKVDKISKLSSPIDNVYELLMKNHNKFIVNILHCVRANNYRFVIMDNIDGVTMREYLQANLNILEDDAINIFLNISYGIQFLHSLDIIHCDIKMDNIMIMDDKSVKLIDFDISIVSDKDIVLDKIMGTSLYICPEICDLLIYSKKADIWALGVIMYKYVTNIYPYDEEMMVTYTQINMERYNKYRDIDFDLLDNGKVPSHITVLIKHMLSFNYDDRPSIDYVINVLKEKN